MQEIWLKAAAVSTQLIVDERSYLFRLANNLITERHRRLWRARRRDADWMRSAQDADAHQVASPVERTLLARERLRTADAALRATGDRAYYILRRFRLDGIGQRQIAEELGLSLSTVEKDLRKAYDVLALLERKADED